jgi:hypothetical protein
MSLIALPLKPTPKPKAERHFRLRRTPLKFSPQGRFPYPPTFPISHIPQYPIPYPRIAFKSSSGLEMGFIL